MWRRAMEQATSRSDAFCSPSSGSISTRALRMAALMAVEARASSTAALPRSTGPSSRHPASRSATSAKGSIGYSPPCSAAAMAASISALVVLPVRSMECAAAYALISSTVLASETDSGTLAAGFSAAAMAAATM